MEHAGWHAPKDIRATGGVPGQSLHWSFYTVPVDWENQ
jgi:hypothetical protein